MSSRAGIIGLAGFGLGVTTLATSKLVGAARGGGTKGFFKQIGTGIATPFKAIGKRFNPQLASKGNQENKRNTKDLSDWRSDSLNKKLGKIENKLNIPKLSNKSSKLQNKQSKINEKLKDHLKISNKRTKKWAEKAAKKAEKKKS